jgi:hypothetical protein
MKEQNSENALAELQSPAGLSRRRFLGYAGAFAGAGLLLSACHNEDDDKFVPVPEDTIDLGSGDIGILNYAYALEQLEAAFYTQVAASFYTGITDKEKALLTDIRDHEIAHREFFKKAIGDKAIPALTPNFTSINFSDRASVLGAAKTFEDLGVSAYNGAGKLITTPDYLVLAGKIVSVEARHAAYIRDLISNGSFADSTDSNGMDKAMMPAEVLAAATPFLKSKLSGSNLPTI